MCDMKLQWNSEQQNDTAGRSRQLLSGDGQKKLFDICAVPGYYAAYSGNSLPTFRDNLSLPF